MTHSQELIFLDSINGFTIPIIPQTTRFWMIRTKKGYFYQEFLSKRFVALAWNNITQETGINPESLKTPIDALLNGCSTLEVEPIILDDASAANVSLANEAQESQDIEDE